MSEPVKRGTVPRLSVEARAGVKSRAGAAAASSPDLDRKIKLAIVVGAAVVLVSGLALGSVPSKIVITLMCLIMLQGMWRGASELVGLVGSSLIAVVLAPVLGRAFEGLFGAIFGTAGILNRMISVGVIGLIIVMGGTAGIGMAARRVIKRHPTWARWNSFAGAGLGLIEGLIMGMGVLWAVLALEPVAASRVEAERQPGYVVQDQDSAGSRAVAWGVVGFAKSVRDSALGGTAEATNPISGSRVLSLSSDFIDVAKDEEAFDYFMKTPTMQEISELPSVKVALERVKADAELTGMFNDKGVTPDTLRSVLESKTILDVLDQTTVVSDLSPRVDGMMRALSEAKTRIGKEPEQPPIPRPGRK